MPTRRSFVAGMLAAGLAPQSTWAEVGDPAFVSAARTPTGHYVLCGLRADGSIAFQIPLPARGHAAAAHPKSAEAVAFARRPGTYAIVLDCASGQVKTRLKSPMGRHFYGHGAFSDDGDLLFTTENDYESGVGVVGVWDVRNGYTRLGEFSSGGIGPHDIKLMPDGQTLVVANGGIETHPDTGRMKLNLSTMVSNLTYLDMDGHVDHMMTLGADHQRNSIRHLAVAADGAVAFAMQWQGDLMADVPLLGVDRRSIGQMTLFEEASVRSMQGYLGSVAINSQTGCVATTSPRSDTLKIFEPNRLIETKKLQDVCGVSALHLGFIATTGNGRVTQMGSGDVLHPMAWDNHLVAL